MNTQSLDVAAVHTLNSFRCFIKILDQQPLDCICSKLYHSNFHTLSIPMTVETNRTGKHVGTMHHTSRQSTFVLVRIGRISPLRGSKTTQHHWTVPMRTLDTPKHCCSHAMLPWPLSQLIVPGRLHRLTHNLISVRSVLTVILRTSYNKNWTLCSTTT